MKVRNFGSLKKFRMAKDTLEIKKEGERIGDRIGRITDFKERVRASNNSKAVDQAIRKANLWEDLKEEKIREVKRIMEKFNIEIGDLKK